MFCLCWCLFHKVAARDAQKLCMLILLSIMALPLIAADIEELQVIKNDVKYYIEMVAVVSVPAKYVHRVLTDYTHIHRLNPAITESEILPTFDNEAVRVRTRIENCFFIFCVEISRVEDIHELPSGDLNAAIVPALSDFKSGFADWRIQGIGVRSRIKYLAQMEPDFYIPPFIGSHFFKAKLREDITIGLKKLECLAKIEEVLAWNPDLQASDINVDTLCAETCNPQTSQC